MNALRVIGHVVRKEFLQVLRDHQMVRIILLMPVLMLLLLGYAVTVDVKHLPLRVLDYDHSPESRQLIERFRFHETFDLVGGVSGPGQVRAELDAGTATAVLVVPAGFGRALGRWEPVRVQILLDGVDSNAALIAYAHARGIVEDFTLDRVRERLQGRPLPDLIPRVQVFYNPELKSRFYMVPGIVVMLLTMLTSILTGLGLVREREKGTLEQLSVTPIRSWQLMIGKTLPFVVIAFFVLALALSVALLWYRVPMRGSWALLVAFSLLFLLNTLSLGLLISTVAHSQQQALFMAWFVNVFAIIMSGFFFPIANMPPVLQKLTLLNPVRYFLAVVRELFLKGSGLEAFPVETAGLLILGPLALLLAALRFHKQAR
jgi:ABC-2 type transport system permease protein